jgi:hypothetical protein
MSRYTAPAVVSTQTSTVLPNNAFARLIGGLSCPNCGRVLRASDFELTDNSVRIVCTGYDCGRLILEIELVDALDEDEVGL